MKKKLWMDTDLGGDVDDALALSLTLHSPELDLIGISTVYIANTWRTGIVRDMLRAYGRADIPVYLGAERPLLGLWGDAAPDPALPNDAVDALVDAARAVDELYVAVIGPATNVALALQKAPDIARKLHLYIMGGMLNMAHPEWNIVCDPEAAEILLASGADIVLVPLDVTEQCRLNKEESLALVDGDSEEMTFLRGEMMRFLTSFNFLPTLHDPLAVAAIVRDDFLTLTPQEVHIELRGQYTRGVTVPRRYSDTPNLRAATAVHVQNAMAFMLERIRED